MKNNESLQALVDALKFLPGVGPKSALRLAYYLLQRDRKGAKHLSDTIADALERLGHCNLCNNFSEEPICSICKTASRDVETLCIVEMPTDLLMLEQTHSIRVCILF